MFAEVALYHIVFLAWRIRQRVNIGAVGLAATIAYLEIKTVSPTKLPGEIALPGRQNLDGPTHLSDTALDINGARHRI
jgi:hypothetical protein